MRLYDGGGKLVRAIEENKVEALNQYKLGKAELLKVKTRDGFEMEAMMIKPPDFDPTKKYPVLEFTYSGPHAPQCGTVGAASPTCGTRCWRRRATSSGSATTAPPAAKASNRNGPLYKNFGELELRDLEDGLTWLKSQPYVDGDRIGLWGWSYGGFMTSYALTHSQSFKIGIAGGTVSDWRNYDSIYTERYMGTPQNNPGRLLEEFTGALRERPARQIAADSWRHRRQRARGKHDSVSL